MKEILLYFHKKRGFGKIHLEDMLHKYGSYEKVFESFQENDDKLDELKKELDEYEKQDIHFVGYDEKDYPLLLKEIYSPPLGIFYRGHLPDFQKPSIAIVGSRNCTTYGREVALHFAKQLSNYGVQIISGMARGVDGYAHEGAILGGTPTFAVLGTGIDVCYPKSNRRLYEKIPLQGGLISEFLPGTLPQAMNFPIRNRIISGLSMGTLVVEARIKSGSLITTHFAQEQNRDVYVIPGRTYDVQSRGCNDLIKQGGKLVDCIEDILEDIHIEKEFYGKNIKKSEIVLETTEKIVYANLRCEPRYVDEITESTGLSSAEVFKSLLLLEHKNMCKQIAPNYYIRFMQKPKYE